uniref:Olfactory receptor 1500-like n=1 Tax=Petromyzon marinus TaxID=7757 RepID=A0AAJ7U8I3_PETMA|nr:olfactory receptor 1500-like [Petromyzon marinus]
MDNGSSLFLLSTFELPSAIQVLIFLPTYMAAVLTNLLLIATVALCAELHKPMYVFLCNLAVGDIIGCTGFVPMQLHILLTGDRHIPFTSCIMQMFWINVFVSNEFLTLAVMALDRYVAICYPLRYHAIVTMKRSFAVLLLTWTMCVAIQLVIHLLIMRLTVWVPICQLQGMFCDHGGLLKLSVSNTRVNEVCGLAGVVLTVVAPLCMMAFTYWGILRQCVKMSSKDFNRKALYTLITHFSVLTICSLVVFTLVLVPRLVGDSRSAFVRTVTLSVQFPVIVVPIANVLIYFFRTKELRKASVKYCQKLFPGSVACFTSHKVCIIED